MGAGVSYVRASMLKSLPGEGVADDVEAPGAEASEMFVRCAILQV